MRSGRRRSQKTRNDASAAWAARTPRMSCQEWMRPLAVGRRSTSKTSLSCGIAGEQTLRTRSEIAFGEFGFDQQTAEAHVDFGAVDVAVKAWDRRAEAEIGLEARIDTEHGAEPWPVEHFGITKDVHEQRVGAGGAVELEAAAVGGAWDETAGGVALAEALAPGRIRQMRVQEAGRKLPWRPPNSA